MSGQPAARLFATGVGLIVIVIAGLSLHVPGELGIGSDRRLATFVGLMGLAGLLYAAAVSIVLRRPLGHGAIWGVMAVALVMRLMVVVSAPFLSSDLYRYVWDGRVQAAGINPYLYIPADAALAGLRDTAIYPNINRADYAPTIYPPIAQALFFAIAAIKPTIWAMKIAVTAFDLLVIFTILRLLDEVGLPPARVLIYAWHPLPVFEFAGSAHVDAVAMALIGLAMLACIGRRSAVSGAMLAGAVLVKFLPAVLLPALWRRWDWRFLAAFVAVIVGAYLCYIRAGWHVFGFLGGYTAEEGLATGSGLYPVFVLAHLVTMPAYAGKIYLILLAAVLAGLGLRMVFSWRAQSAPPRLCAHVLWSHDLCAHVLLLATVVTVGLSPHYPWYFCWLLPASCVVPRWSVLYLSFACFLIYLNPIHSEVFWPSVVYLPFGVIALLLDIFGRRLPDPVSVSGALSRRF